MSELHELSASQQLRALRAREVGSRELTEHYLTRIGKFGTEFGAFVTLLPDLALEQADRADERLARGEWAPLRGLPFGLKDLHPSAGIRTTFGSAALADYVPTEDSWTVGLLRQAGAVVLGKTNVSEFGATCYADNDVTERPAVTPYDPTRPATPAGPAAAQPRPSRPGSCRRLTAATAPARPALPRRPATSSA